MENGRISDKEGFLAHIMVMLEEQRKNMCLQ